ncbi:MAG: signal peptide peptidase SppA [Oligoflexia bacterium]|nr:signal peptide peptidase SppA [Oligoflexia bacterium]
MRAYFLWLAKFITIVVLLVVVLPLLLSAIAAVVDNTSDSGSSHLSVAVIEMNGMITDSKETLEQLHKQISNDKVKGIVLRVDSPGGAVGPSQEIFSAVQRLKKEKPIVVSMGSVAASGGLYVSLAASKIYCQPGTITGSIGVILQVPNFTKIASQVGVEMVTVKSGKLKDVGNTFRPMTDEEREFLQGTVNESYTAFVQAVVDGRGIPREKVLQFADGRIILGSKAVELGLVDGFGDVYDAARTVFELAGTPLKETEHPKLIYPAEKFAEVKRLLGTVSSIGSMLSEASHASAPRMQYLMN